VAKATKNKKSKEGRHVGLDFYDLLIEALKTPSMSDRALRFYDSNPGTVRRKGLVKYLGFEA
jgi:hypothetical protein